MGSDEGSESLSYHSSLSLVLLARTVEIDWTSPAFQSGTLRRGGIDLATARVPGPEVEAPRVVSARRKDISRGLAKVHGGATTFILWFYLFLSVHSLHSFYRILQRFSLR